MLDTSFTGASSSRPASRPSSSRQAARIPRASSKSSVPQGVRRTPRGIRSKSGAPACPLQLRHGVGNRRLGEEQLLRRPGKGARPRDRLQNFQMPQVHHVPPDMN